MRRAEVQEQELFLSAIAPRVEPFAARSACVEDAGRFGATLADDSGLTRSYASFVPGALKLSEQLEQKELPGYTARASIRAALADKIEHEVFEVTRPRWLERYPLRLRTARQSGAFGVQVATGRPVVFWDSKAGLSRLCPDDAREEAMRLTRRNEPTLQRWVDSGLAHRITYAVFTIPNTAPRHLRGGMEAIFTRFKRVIAKSGEFPQIKGSLCVLEAPLGAARDWNVHLNVLLLHDGFVDWGKVRRLWHWNVHLQQLPKAPGAIGSALRELIKYAVAATVSKSEEKAEAAAGDGDDYYQAPPMLQWSALELAEWLHAFHGFRRTRSYGVLYNLERPQLEGLGAVAWLGRITWRAGRYWHRLVLLNSIPEDKSALDTGPQDRRTAWQRFKHRLKLDQVGPLPPITTRLGEISEAVTSHPLIIGTR